MSEEGWIILRCAGRSTLRLAETLAEDGFDVWTPVEVTSVVPRGHYRSRHGRKAMLARYVFARDHHDQDLLRLSSSRHRHPVFAVFMDAGDIAYCSDKAIELVRDEVAKAEANSVPRKRISPYSRGARVSVKRGPYEGCSGEIERSDGKSAQVWLSLFGRHQKVNLPIYFLRGEDRRKAA